MVEVGQSRRKALSRGRRGRGRNAEMRSGPGCWSRSRSRFVLVAALSLSIGRSISKALSAMVAAMTQACARRSSGRRPGLGRRDEIGEMAGAVDVFKNNMVETERLRAEQPRPSGTQAERRKADMRELADAFEGAVGEIIETVSSAATELEASANTLTVAAEPSNSLATAVAAASEEASANVQSVSAASEEMTASIGEISRQVQESSRVASEAVGQAQKTNARVSELSKAASPHRRRGRTDQHHRRPDQSAGAQRHHRGGARGRGRPRLCGGRLRGEGAGRADREGDRRDQPADFRHPGRDARIRSMRSRRSAGPSAGCRRFSTIAAAVEEQGAATQEISRNIQHAAQGTRRFPPTSSTCSAAPARPGRRRRRCMRRHSRCPSESNRLKLEVAKFLDTVRRGLI